MAERLEHLDAPAPGVIPEWFAGLLAERVSAAVIPAVIPEGERNHTLARFAGSMRRAGADEETILAALRVMNKTQCRPPLDDAEVRKIATSIATNYPAGAQAQYRGAGTVPTLPDSF